MGTFRFKALAAAFFALLWATVPLPGQQIKVRTIRPDMAVTAPHYDGEQLYFQYKNLVKSPSFYKGESIILIPCSVKKKRIDNYYSNFRDFSEYPDHALYLPIDPSLLPPYKKVHVERELVSDIDGTDGFLTGDATPYDAVEGVPFQIVDAFFNTDSFGIHDYRLLLKDQEGNRILFVNNLEMTRYYGEPETYVVQTEKDPEDGGYSSSYGHDKQTAVVEHYPATSYEHKSRPFFMAGPIEKAQGMVGKSFRVKPDAKSGTDGRYVRAMDGGKYYAATGVYRCTEVCFMPVGFKDEMVPCMVLTDKDGKEFFSTIGISHEIKPYDEPAINGSATKMYSNLVILHDLIPVKE